MLNNGVVDYAARAVKVVPSSTCEAEMIVASLATKATCFVRMFLLFHGFGVSAPTPMLGDNQAMYDLCQQEGASVRTRYYERAVLLIKRAVLMLILTPYLIGTKFMLADIFTKATDKGTFVRMRNVMMNTNCSLRALLALSTESLHGEARSLVDRLSGRI